MSEPREASPGERASSGAARSAPADPGARTQRRAGATVGKLYAVSLAALFFAVTLAAVSARPWGSPAAAGEPGHIGRSSAMTQARVDDRVRALDRRDRRCLVLTQWKEHCRVLAEGLLARSAEPLVLEGGLRKKAREAIMDRIASASPADQLVVVATGQYLGEGVDCPQLDSLFLAFPVAFKGRLVQYTGRLLRAHERKTSVRVYDYGDVRVPVLRAMQTRRLATYKSLGFTKRETTLPLAAGETPT